MKRHYAQAVVAIVLLLMTACSEPPKTETSGNANSSPSGPVPGKTAFWPMYKAAYSWAKDVVPLKLESKDFAGIKNEGGNAGMWTATFASPQKHQVVLISYAVASHAPDISKGVSVGNPIPWGGPSRDVMPFQTSDLATDSDAAYKAALPQAEPWLKSHPDKQVSFLMGNNPARFSSPVWYVLWGDSKSGYAVFVNARTGEVIKPGK